MDFSNASFLDNTTFAADFTIFPYLVGLKCALSPTRINFNFFCLIKIPHLHFLFRKA